MCIPTVSGHILFTSTKSIQYLLLLISLDKLCVLFMFLIKIEAIANNLLENAAFQFVFGRLKRLRFEQETFVEEGHLASLVAMSVSG